MSTTSPTVKKNEKCYLYLHHNLQLRSTWEHVKYRLKNGIERWGTFISTEKKHVSDSPYVILENIGEVDSYICNKNDTEGHLYRSNGRPFYSFKLDGISEYFKISSDKSLYILISCII